MSEQRIKRLYCSCCGRYAHPRQWWNMDTGYGVCERCADDNAARHGGGGRDDEPCAVTTYRLYGRRGHHFAIPGARPAGEL